MVVIMRSKLLIFSLFITVLLSLPLVFSVNVPDKIRSTYPWDITLQESGLTRVFGLTLGQTSFADARKTIGEAVKLALLSIDDEPGSVEMYYAYFTAGRLTGRLIFVADLDQHEISSIRKRAIRSGGANSFKIHNDDLGRVMKAVIRSITFIPIVDLDEKIIIQRFGNPSQIIRNNKTLSHYLYPEKGLDVILDSEGKEVLQYVAPHQFQLILEPLMNKETSE